MKKFFKITSGFLCAFFPLFVAQWLSHDYLIFPLNLIVGLILLTPFFFIAKALWKMIDCYYNYIDETDDQERKQRAESITQAKTDAYIQEILDNNNNKSAYETNARKYDVITNSYSHSFSNTNINLREPTEDTGDTDYLDNAAHRDVASYNERDALLRYHKLRKELKILSSKQKQIKKEIDDITLVSNKLKHDYVILDDQIKKINFQINQVVSSEEISDMLKRRKISDINTTLQTGKDILSKYKDEQG